MSDTASDSARTDHEHPEHPEGDHGADDHGADDHGADDHGADDHGADDHGADDHGIKHYLTIWAALVVLLLISVAGPTLEIRVVTLITAFGVAVVKAYLVCKHFMHLDLQPKFVLYFLGGALVLMLLFVGGVAPDVLEHAGANWQNTAAQHEVESELAAQERAANGEAGEAGEAGPFDADATFRGTCGPCHGEGGAGDGPAAAALDPHPANFTDPTFWETRDHDHVVQTITEGGAAVGRSPVMPAFGTRFSAEEIEQLAQHVDGLRPQ